MPIDYTDVVSTDNPNYTVICIAIEQITTGLSGLWTAATLCSAKYMADDEWNDAFNTMDMPFSQEGDEKDMLAAFILLSEGYDLDELFDFSNPAPSKA